jgi:manganese transport protein
MSSSKKTILTNHPSAPSLPEVNRSIDVSGSSKLRTLIRFAGPGLLVSVGYMDPGNWATDIAAGAKFEYKLLFVIFISNLIAILFQSLAARLGVVTQRDLAQACRDYFPNYISKILWVLCEIAIIACDLAEVLGSAIALKLLFGIPLLVGVCLTAIDVMVILFLQHKGFRYIEAVVGAVIIVIGLCFAFEIFWAQPIWGEVARGLIPSTEIFKNNEMLYLAVGILGATVMPHNLYLHSSIVQTRAISRTVTGVREAIYYNNIDSTVALSLAFFVNAAILVMAASVFYQAGIHDIATIEDAYETLAPLLGTQAAGIVFAIALLCSGQNSTLTGTLAGQIVMEGFIDLKIKPWMRRLLTRSLAIIPAIIVIALYGEGHTTNLLILSQVVLSLQLPFAVIPLVLFTNSKKKMGEFANGPVVIGCAWIAAAVVVLLNGWLLIETARSW